MTKLFLSVLVITLMTACANQSAEKGDFYTWVDESGQIRTVKRQVKSPIKKQPDNSELVGINPEDYKASSDVERELKAEKMFSWQDQGRQNIYELDTSSPQNANQKTKPMNTMPLKDLLDYEGGPEQFILWSRVKNTEIKLDQFYHYNKTLKKDELLIELPMDLAEQVIFIQSYIHKNTIALPTITFLSDRQQYISQPITPYSEYVAETWMSYAAMNGLFRIPKGAAFLLMSASSDFGMLEFQNQKIKQVNLGSIMMRVELK